jgi:peptide-methionine (R)-S-oxide reductase
MQLSEEEWRAKLTPEQYRILRKKGTETPFTGDLLQEKRAGMFACAACGNELFSSGTKFESRSGWPSFYDVARSDALKLVDDDSHFMRRVEVQCAKCGSHLGHVFDDGPRPTGQRYCINSVCLQFKPEEKKT